MAGQSGATEKSWRDQAAVSRPAEEDATVGNCGTTSYEQPRLAPASHCAFESAYDGPLAYWRRYEGIGHRARAVPAIRARRLVTQPLPGSGFVPQGDQEVVAGPVARLSGCQ